MIIQADGALPRTEEDLERLAEWLDSKFHGPFGTRFGWDALLGLIPGVGDLATTSVSGYIIVRAAMLGVSFSVLLRMVGNVLIDNLIDMVPLVGWLGDFAWKSNLKNLTLLRRHAADPRELARRSRAWVITVSVVLVLALIGFAVALGVLAWWLAGWVSRSVGEWR